MDFPMEANHKLGLGTARVLEHPTQHRSLVGRLLYLTLTRPELSYSIHILSQFMQALQEAHMDTARRVLRYLKGNIGQGILLRSDFDLCIIAFCDSDREHVP